MKKGQLLFYTIILCGCVLANDSQELDLGGMRQAKAIVNKDENGYHCSISFIPVSCFDAPSNQKINQRKGRYYATRALALSTGIQGRSIVTIKHLELVENQKFKDGRAFLRYSASDVYVVKEPTPKQEPKTVEPGVVIKKPDASSPLVMDLSAQHTLLGCLDDYQTTLHTLAEYLSADIKSINRENLEDNVATLEDHGMRVFEQLTVKIKSEKLLLSLEKTQLINEVKSSEAKFIKLLSSAYKAMNEATSSAP